MKEKKKHLVLPYLIGVGWILHHPIVSVLTGENKCRGIYIDEHQLDPHSYDTKSVISGKEWEPGPTKDRPPTPDVFYPSLLDDIFESVTRMNDQDDPDICSILDAITHYVDLSKVTKADDDKDDENDFASVKKNTQLLQLARTLSSPSVTCHSSDKQHGSSSSFQVIKIEPKVGPTSPIEALVIVVPPPQLSLRNSTMSLDDKSVVAKSVLFMMSRIIEESYFNLAKTLLFVFCTNDEDSILKYGIGTKDSHDAAIGKGVHDFLVANGAAPSSSSPSRPTTTSSLSSFQYTKYIIRQLIVLDIQTDTSIKPDQTSFHIIPQGSHGQLPNLDFVANAIFSFHYVGMHKIIPSNYPKQGDDRHGLIHMHSYNWFVSWWRSEVVDRYFSSDTWWELYGSRLGSMFSFMANAIFRPAPHSHALNNGIDALTIKANIATESMVDKVAATTKINHVLYGVEHILRGLNVLQELLHHNVNQYIMVSSMKFVSLDEYIIPIILILLPLVIRILKIIYFGSSSSSSSSRKEDEGSSNNNGMKQHCLRYRYNNLKKHCFRFGISIRAISASFLLSMFVLFLNRMILINDIRDNGSVLALDCAFVIAYLFALQFVTRSGNYQSAHQKSIQQRKEEKESLHVVSCLMALYIHLPIALVHMSLALSSALFWVPLVAFPLYAVVTGEWQYSIGSKVRRILVLMMLPPVAKHILTFIIALAIHVNSNMDIKSVLSSIISDFGADSIVMLKEMNTLSSTYFCCVYIPIHFIISAIYFI